MQEFIDGISTKSQQNVMEALHESAVINARGAGELFCAYEPNLRRFPHQSISTSSEENYLIRGNPLEPDMSDAVATTIDSRYRELPDSIQAFDDRTRVLSQAGEVLKGGFNLIFGEEHSELIDLPFAHVGISNFYRRKDIAHRSAMIVSKAMDYLGIRVEALPAPADFVEEYLGGLGVKVLDDGTVPVRDFLKLAADETYLTLPSSQSFEGIRKLESHRVSAFNKKVRGAIDSSFKQGSSGGKAPLLMSIALPGTVNKLLDKPAYVAGSQLEGNYTTIPSRLEVDDGRPIEVIGRISPALASFTGNALTYATVIRLDQSPPAVEVGGSFICMDSPESIGRVACQLVSIASSLERGIQFVYDETGNLPVVRK